MITSLSLPVTALWIQPRIWCGLATAVAHCCLLFSLRLPAAPGVSQQGCSPATFHETSSCSCLPTLATWPDPCVRWFSLLTCPSQPHRLVPPANLVKLLSTPSSRPFMKTLNSMGAWIHPWGFVLVAGFQPEYKPLTTTLWVPPLSHFHYQPTDHPCSHLPLCVGESWRKPCWMLCWSQTKGWNLKANGQTLH